MTLAQERELEMSQMMGMYQYDLETGSVSANENTMQTPEVALDPSVYENSRSCYDTPGVVNENQVCEKDFLLFKFFDKILHVAKAADGHARLNMITKLLHTM